MTRAIPLILRLLIVSAGLLILVCVLQVSAQEPPESIFITDRPGIGDTAYLVPSGYIQLEGGVTYQHDRTRSPLQRITTVSMPNTVIRIGIFEEMEFRLLGGEYVYEKISVGNQEAQDHSVSAPIIGTKLRLTKEDARIPQTAVFLNLTLPVGSRRLHPDDVTPDFKVAGNYSLTEKVSWEANLGAAWEDGLSHVTGFYTTALGLSISDRLATFAEVFGNMNGPSTHGFDTGLTYLILPTLQLDISGGPALTDAAADWFIAAGISYRLPKLW